MTISKEPETELDHLRKLIQGSARALTNIAPTLVTLPQIEAVVEQNKPAVERGYFLPN